VPLTSTVQEAELLFAASDNMKALAASGDLKEMHSNVEAGLAKATAEYTQIRDRLLTLIHTAQSKENELLNEVKEDFPDLNLSSHGTTDIMSVFTGSGFTSIENLRAVEKLKATEGEFSAIHGHEEQLRALVEVQAHALQNLVMLQNEWVDSVEKDAVTKDELRHFREKHSVFASQVKEN